MNITGRCALVIVAALLISACGRDEPASPERVAAEEYSAFYLWSGVEPIPAMEKAEAVYLLWGELRLDDPSRIVPLRRTVPTGNAQHLWLVVRAERLDWSEAAFDQLLNQVRRWKRGGVLTGVQVDFDSSTGGLGRYAEFLSEMRARLPAGLQLSATGLMDWPANASKADLAKLGSALDEIVVQTYQKTETAPDYARYLAHLGRLDVPYRIALAERSAWSPPKSLGDDPNFIGYVVFLIDD